jgi:hypothetical protein
MEDLLNKMYHKLEKIDDKLSIICERIAVIETKCKWLKLNIFAVWGIIFSSVCYLLSRFIQHII